MLLPTSELRDRLIVNFRCSERSWIYSAFITVPGIDLVLKNRTVTLNDRLLIRCNVADVLSGACSLDAVELALLSGIQIRVSSALHVKLYVFDTVLYVGSANLTGSGLALVGYRNDELSTEGSPSERDLQIAENLWSEGVMLGFEELVKMRDFIDQCPKSSSKLISSWPDDIFFEERSLYCSDFPQGEGLDEDRWVSSEQLEVSVAYRWMIKALKENGGEASFGYLSARLHNDLYDDPTPYRREVKDLLANLIKLTQHLKSDQIAISAPGYSQILRLNH